MAEFLQKRHLGFLFILDKSISKLLYPLLKWCILKRWQRWGFRRRPERTFASQRYRQVFPRMTLFPLCLIFTSLLDKQGGFGEWYLSESQSTRSPLSKFRGAPVGKLESTPQVQGRRLASYRLSAQGKLPCCGSGSRSKLGGLWSLRWWY